MDLEGHTCPLRWMQGRQSRYTAQRYNCLPTRRTGVQGADPDGGAMEPSCVRARVPWLNRSSRPQQRRFRRRFGDERFRKSARFSLGTPSWRGGSGRERAAGLEEGKEAVLLLLRGSRQKNSAPCVDFAREFCWFSAIEEQLPFAAIINTTAAMLQRP